MGWTEYKTGVVAPDGYAERWNAYMCDVPDCGHEAVEPYDFDRPYSGLCDDHIAEAKDADATEQEEPYDPEPCHKCTSEAICELHALLGEKLGQENER
jgi:hypothetical protein